MRFFAGLLTTISLAMSAPVVCAQDGWNEQDAKNWRQEKMAAITRFKQEYTQAHKEWEAAVQAALPRPTDGSLLKKKLAEIDPRLVAFVEATNLDALRKFKDNPRCAVEIERLAPQLESVKRGSLQGEGLNANYSLTVGFCTMSPKVGAAIQKLQNNHSSSSN